MMSVVRAQTDDVANYHFCSFLRLIRLVQLLVGFYLQTCVLLYRTKPRLLCVLVYHSPELPRVDWELIGTRECGIK